MKMATEEANRKLRLFEIPGGNAGADKTVRMHIQKRHLKTLLLQFF